MSFRSTTKKTPRIRRRLRGPAFTREEDNFLRKHSLRMPDRSLAKHLGRTLRSVRSRRRKLGLAKTVCRRWSQEEIAAIRAVIERGGHTRELMERYGHRCSEWSTKARKLGLSFRAGRRKHRYPFINRRGRKVVGFDPIRERYLFEYEAVMERRLGRRMRLGEVIHHINFDKTDNRDDNLFLCPSVSVHRHLHVSFEQIVPALIRLGLIGFNRAKGIYELCETDRSPAS